MSKPHKWEKEIVAWANGADIECRDITYGPGLWGPWTETPIEWDNPDYEFRIAGQKDESSLIETLIKIARRETTAESGITTDDYMDISMNTVYQFGYEDGETLLARTILREKGIEWSAKVTYE